MTNKPKAIALYSGGLDSALAILVMIHHEVEVEALKFIIPFGYSTGDMPSGNSTSSSVAKEWGFNIINKHLGWDFVEIVKNPKFGRGKNMNPCIDCRLLMLKEAGVHMERSGADFVITGEVLGQRPLSQLRDNLDMIAEKSGLGGRLVRPLSGKLLPPTLPEKEGLIKREWLLDIQGRSRKKQIALAKKFGLKDYSSPAGGCLLTDQQYSRKIEDLFTFESKFDFNDIDLLRVGRHFRLSERCKLIIGRNEEENKAILYLSKKSDFIFEVMNVGSPIGLLRGKASQDDIKLAVSITARYSDAKTQKSVIVNIKKGDQSKDIPICPIDNEILNKYRI
ncbi:MAG: hypothetical protein B6D58_07990 [candidate division Zixibacteria bacterium 4484_95]|nr:MAG: hypothetical protein B6D58_07990 [candidate division Zixibacteria bacterium 4484_95]